MIRIFLSGFLSMLKEMENNLGQLKPHDWESIKCVVGKISERCNRILEKIEALTSDDNLTQTVKIDTSERERPFFKTKEVSLDNVSVPGSVPKPPTPKSKSKNKKRRAS